MKHGTLSYCFQKSFTKGIIVSYHHLDKHALRAMLACGVSNVFLLPNLYFLEREEP